MGAVFLSVALSFSGWTLQPRQAAPELGAFERGRALTTWLLDANVENLSDRMSPALLAEMGGRDGLATFAARVRAQAGSERRVLREEAFREGSSTAYYRVSRFQRLPDVTIQWNWNGEGAVTGVTVTPSAKPAASTYLQYETIARLRLPFRSPNVGTWYVAWGGRDPILNYHVVAADQRFAYDFIVTRDGRLHTGRGERNEDYFCFSEPVLAPAAGRVVAVVDAITDNVPGRMNAAAPPGNYVVIDHGRGEHSLIAHFRRGSSRVRVGEMVATGEVLGACGNSGNSSMPHVHYHLQTGARFKNGAGLPAFFNAYFVGGRFVARGEPLRGQMIAP